MFKISNWKKKNEKLRKENEQLRKNKVVKDVEIKESIEKPKEINAGITKQKKSTPKQTELLNLFNDLSDTILIDKTLKPKSQEDNTLMSSKDENENINENENDEILMSSDKDDDEVKKILIHSHEYAETTNQNEKNIRIKKLNDHLDKIIDKSKSFEEQITLLEKVENLEEYYFISDFDDKELDFKIFELKLAHLSNIIGKKLFEQISGHTLIKLANKLTNTTNKEENETIVKNINKNKDKLYEQEKMPYAWVIQPNDQRINLIDAIELILYFDETIQLDLV